MQTRHPNNWNRILFGAAGGLLLVLSTAQAQEPGPKPAPQESESKDPGTQGKDSETSPFAPMDEILSPHGGGQQNPQERIRQLFGEVETHLRDVDRLLGDAAAGDTARLSEASEAGIGKLLQDSLARGREAQAKIAEIMQLAKAASVSESSSGQSDSEGEGDPSSQGQGKDSPLNRGEQRQSQEQTPEMGGDQPQGQQEGEGQEGEQPGEKPGEKPDGEQQGGSDPKNPGGDDSAGENKSSSDPAEGAAERARQAAEARDGWGDLPSHVKDTFRSQGRSELPVRYRDWIDEYYRKLNRKGDR